MDVLLGVAGTLKGVRLELEKPRVRLGRGRSNEIVLTDDAVSRSHAEIMIEGERVFVRDLESTNGTYLNDRRVKKEELRPGDKLGIGSTVFIFQSSRLKARTTSIVFQPDSEGASRVSVDSSATVLLSATELSRNEMASKQLGALYSLMTDVPTFLDLPRLLERAMDHIFDSLMADRGFIALLDEEGTPEPRVTRTREPSSASEFSVSRSLAERVLGQGEAILTAAEGVSSVLVAPVRARERIVGMVYLDTLKASPPLVELDLQLLTAMANLVGICVENARLYESLSGAVELSSAVIGGLKSGLLVVDTGDAITRVNDAALDILSLKETDVLGRKVEDFKNLRPLARLLDRTLNEGPLDQEELVVTCGGRDVPLGATSSVLHGSDGSVVGAVVNFRDLSLVKKLSEEVRMSQHLAALGELAAGIAHEVRNPLNAIQGFAQLIREGVEDAQMREYLQIIEEEVSKLDAMVEDLLEYGRQREFTISPLDVSAVVAQAVELFRKEFEEKGVGLEVKLPLSPPLVLGNAGRLERVFSNVILNALQATSSAGGLTITAEERADALAVIFSDTGCGMDERTLAQIFQPFYTTKDRGTGLGLAICRKLVDSHGGRIDVRSEKGEGSVFEVILPALISEDAETVRVED